MYIDLSAATGRPSDQRIPRGGIMAKKQFKAESKRLMDLMINSIYTHKEIFLRRSSPTPVTRRTSWPTVPSPMTA